ncbi:hypothetical protein L9F63_022199 [Diploptera punctata]|uniref:Uncharacterized protein n=1 Tax=Diploptera punctata TaxID=6984 RepID=A0AAD7ZNS8_DIPPU|nr:hypothetical protein L9F63_022199 [Diploptera punctata]
MRNAIGSLVLPRPSFWDQMATIISFTAESGLFHRAFSSIWKRKNIPTVPQCSYVEGMPNLGFQIYKQEVNRWSNKPYKFKFNHPLYVITGIACRPKDNNLPSPEAQVLEGGISHDHVTMELTPVEDGQWSCVIDICGRPSSEKCEKSEIWKPNA